MREPAAATPAGAGSAAIMRCWHDAQRNKQAQDIVRALAAVPTNATISKLGYCVQLVHGPRSDLPLDVGPAVGRPEP